MEKTKVAWICYFSNEEIQALLQPGRGNGEFAPWISNTIKLFESRNEIELHIISSNYFISSYKYLFLRNINYHFYNPIFTILGKSLRRFNFDSLTRHWYIKRQIRRILNNIKPDVIHLHGAEVNYSSSIFQFKKKYPILITIQGFISHASQQNDCSIKKRVQVEQKIFRQFRHFGYRTQTMGKDILKYCPNAILHWHKYAINKIKMGTVDKKYDLVFFARVTKDKGIEDLLEVLALVKKTYPDIRLCIIGGTNNNYINNLKKIAIQLNISNNITWTGYILKQSEMFKIAASARISVLPTYHDIIPGTIIESMFLKLPVVAYDVGSIHEVNDKEDCLSLVPKGDIEGFSLIINSLLQNPEEMRLKSERAYKQALEMFDNKTIYTDLLKSYNNVIDAFVGEVNCL